MACSTDDEESTWEEYTQWRELNEAWLEEQAARTNDDGTPLYTKVVPVWNNNTYVLMRWYNDTLKTRNNLSPIYTSTVDVKYYGQLYTDEPFDSSYLSLSPADSVSRFQLNQVISGWAIAMERMHVGDSVEVLVPYIAGYGSTSTDVILPYSALKFQIKLVNVAGEYVRVDE